MLIASIQASDNNLPNSIYRACEFVEQRDRERAPSTTKDRDLGSSIIHHVESIGQNVHREIGRAIADVANGRRCVGFSIDDGSTVAIQIDYVDLVSDLVHCNCIGRHASRHGSGGIGCSVNDGHIIAVYVHDIDLIGRPR